MSGQWEVVVGKKSKPSKLPVLKNSEKHENKKKNVLNGVKIEEVLPKSQVENIYGSVKNKENNKPKEKSNKTQDAKKPQKKVEKTQEAPKPKPPKSIESALTSINVEEFVQIYEKNRTLYPDTPIVWLKELVQFLNQKVPIELADPVFTNKQQGYPLNVVPLPIKTVIEKSVKETGKSNIQLFFDIALTSMTTEMSKGLPALGWKFFLQYIATIEPKLVVTSISKHIVLRNSYQNRSNVGLSILWAVGQVGFADFNSGLRVFQELMLPLMEMKAYSRFIAKYLLDIITSNKDISLTKEEYLLILDTIHSNKKNFPNELKNDFSKQADKLKQSLFGNPKEKYNPYVDAFLNKIISNSNKAYQNSLSSALIEVFQRDPSTFVNWSKGYSKNLAASVIVMKYLYENWKSVSVKINIKQFVDLLNNFKVTNEELSNKKKKDDALYESINIIKKMEQKMAAKKKSGSKMCYFFLPMMGIFLFTFGPRFYNYVTEECLKKNNPSDFCYYTNLSVNKTHDAWVCVDKSVETQFPQYKQKLDGISKPYVRLVQDLGVVVYNLGVNVKDYAVETYPALVKSIDSYAPGLIEQSQRTAQNVWSTSVVYYTRSLDYLKNEVFVGQLSPENMQRAVFDAYNVTQTKTSEYISWIYEKVQTSIK
ncbi:unnamed protein product [Brassicogethes aeneus]|uniref:Transmembrane protein 214-A n=1 Tax=Brassicogethes aeneus TaxID=1431903 RepID=A0A9P0FE05_BRAAE|nr:unnamed protein product [Brassicogethes aeneus]